MMGYFGKAFYIYKCMFLHTSKQTDQYSNYTQQ